MKNLNINQLTVSLLVALGVGLHVNWWVALCSGAFAGLIFQIIVDTYHARVRREKALTLIEKKLACIQESLKKKTASSTNTNHMCIVVQEINKEKSRDERNYFVLTDPVSESDWFKLMNSMSQLKNANRVQAIFPSHPNTLANRTLSNFISDQHSDKSFYFPSHLISFN